MRSAWFQRANQFWFSVGVGCPSTRFPENNHTTSSLALAGAPDSCNLCLEVQMHLFGFKSAFLTLFQAKLGPSRVEVTRQT